MQSLVKTFILGLILHIVRQKGIEDVTNSSIFIMAHRQRCSRSQRHCSALHRHFFRTRFHNWPTLPDGRGPLHPSSPRHLLHSHHCLARKARGQTHNSIHWTMFYLLPRFSHLERPSRLAARFFPVFNPCVWNLRCQSESQPFDIGLVSLACIYRSPFFGLVRCEQTI